MRRLITLEKNLEGWAHPVMGFDPILSARDYCPIFMSITETLTKLVVVFVI